MNGDLSLDYLNDLYFNAVKGMNTMQRKQYLSDLIESVRESVKRQAHELTRAYVLSFREKYYRYLELMGYDINNPGANLNAKEKLSAVVDLLKEGHLNLDTDTKHVKNNVSNGIIEEKPEQIAVALKDLSFISKYKDLERGYFYDFKDAIVSEIMKTVSMADSEFLVMVKEIIRNEVHAIVFGNIPSFWRDIEFIYVGNSINTEFRCSMQNLTMSNESFIRAVYEIAKQSDWISYVYDFGHFQKEYKDYQKNRKRTIISLSFLAFSFIGTICGILWMNFSKENIMPELIISVFVSGMIISGISVIICSTDASFNKKAFMRFKEDIYKKLINNRVK